MGAMGPLMGVVMGACPGVDGKQVRRSWTIIQEAFMMRVLSILLILILCVCLVQASTETTWTHEFDAGYIVSSSLSMIQCM